MPSSTTITVTTPAEALIPPIRKASRQLVREWGFMKPTLAGTTLSATAVHALIEVGEHGVDTAAELARLLRVDVAGAERAVAELVAAGYVVSEEQQPRRLLLVTARGRETLAGVNARSSAQVERALAGMEPEGVSGLVSGLTAYAEALGATAAAATVTVPESQEEEEEVKMAAGKKEDEDHHREKVGGVRIVAGYLPGILGRTLEMHMDYYSKTVQWGKAFESSVAVEMAELLGRLDKGVNEAWSAVQTVPGSRGGEEERIVGTIFVDGEVPEQPGVARLRCFIVDEHVRGLGVGRKLMNAAMDFVRAAGFREVILWTMGSLLAAVRLYEDAGFKLVFEKDDIKWGQRANFRQYLWKAAAAAAAAPPLLEQQQQQQP